MILNRRDFLSSSATVSAAIAPAFLTNGFGAISKFADITGAVTTAQLMSNEVINECVLRAVDAGKAAGASFVDARITRSVVQGPTQSGTTDVEEITFGVRAFVNGVWGFAASAFVDLDEGKFLAESAVSQAKINSVVFPRDIDLGSYPAVKGEWATPVRIDPFAISIDEKADFIRSLGTNIVPRYVPNRRYSSNLSLVSINRIEKIIATSEGSLYKQTLYETSGEFAVGIEVYNSGQQKTSLKVTSDDIYRCGAGWELFLDTKLREQVPKLIEEGERRLEWISEPVQVGRYELVATAGVAASLVSATLGYSAQLDRIIGYEANAGGTSYLGPDYASNLGSVWGAKEVNIRADRGMARGLATSKWDDEGVETKEFHIVKDGKIVDFFTDREMSILMKPWYSTQNREFTSNACSRTNFAKTLPLVHTPNMRLMPGNGSGTFDEMVKATERGIAFVAGGAGTDFQSRSGSGDGLFREIRNGVMGPVLTGAQALFDSKEIWKSVLEIGNGAEQATIPVLTGKGQPGQSSTYSVQGVPIRLKDIAIVDGTRKS